MQPSESRTTNTHPLERFLVLAAAVACVVITIIIWRSVSAYQGMWPLPGLYFVELVALAVISAWAFVGGGARGRLLTWGAVGIFLAFSILGGFSVGFFYLPVAFLFGLGAIISDVRNKQMIAAHVGVCVITGVAQAALMLAVVWLL